MNRLDPDEDVGTCRLDLELRYVEVSPWLAYLHGFAVWEHIGKTIRELLPEMADVVEVQLENVIETGTPLLKGQAYAETPAHPGLKRLYQHDFIPVKDDDGNVVGVTCVVRDVTRRWMKRDIERIIRYTEIFRARQTANNNRTVRRNLESRGSIIVIS